MTLARDRSSNTKVGSRRGKPQEILWTPSRWQKLGCTKEAPHAQASNGQAGQGGTILPAWIAAAERLRRTLQQAVACVRRHLLQLEQQQRKLLQYHRLREHKQLSAP
eukprot:6191062-Pleurochrysis_carterae.AAC.1